jgi:penicillin-binding protein 1C
MLYENPYQKRVHAQLKKIHKKFPILWQIFRYFFLFFAFFRCLDLFFPLQIDVPYSPIVVDKKGAILHSFLTTDDKWRMYTTLPEISPQLSAAIIYKEDKYFYYHWGINPIALVRAAMNNLLQQKRTSGASTITMQVARLLDPKARTYWHKLVEMFRALQLEWHYSKAEILQHYLNLVPYGGNIEGIKSAAVLFFGKTPEQLSPAEIATLAIIPNRPTSLALGKNNDKNKQERNRWLQTFADSGIFSEQSIAEAMTEPLNAERQSVPRMAPHLSLRLQRHYADKIIHTTIDANQQRKIEQITYNYMQRYYAQRIRNAAVLVIDNRTHEIVAYVGSADFANIEDGGQVDGIRAVRSPGSTLKPLLTALAFDEGLITPQQKMLDVPMSFSGYSPLNYDRTFNGRISCEYALSHSLNLPFVGLLEQYGTSKFVENLVQLHCQEIKKAPKLGLSLILGGCGTTLEELTNLYSIFPNEGQFIPAHYLVNDTLNSPQTICSPSATYIVTDILDELTRPDLPTGVEASSINLPRIAWKTGTSYGRKDAWSIGYNKNYTIGVWVGNFSGEGNQNLTGTNVATPLLFEVFNTIDYRSKAAKATMPAGLERRWVCSETGLPPDPHFCTNKIMDYYLPTISTNSICEHRKQVLVNTTETMSYCTACAPADAVMRWYNNLPPELIAFYEQEKMPYQKIPPHNPQCERYFTTGTPPRILHPTHQLKYLIDRKDNEELLLRCAVSPEVAKVFWYVNDAFVAAATPKERVFFVPKVGNNKITCVDDKGRQQTIYIDVVFL